MNDDVPSAELPSEICILLYSSTDIVLDMLQGNGPAVKESCRQQQEDSICAVVEATVKCQGSAGGAHESSCLLQPVCLQ